MDDCCHSCHRLEENEIFIGGRNVICGSGMWPNQNQSQCEPLHEDEDDIPNYDRLSSPVITVEVLAFLFLLVILAFSVLFFIKRTNPIVSKWKSGKKPAAFILRINILLP